MKINTYLALLVIIWFFQAVPSFSQTLTQASSRPARTISPGGSYNMSAFVYSRAGVLFDLGVFYGQSESSANPSAGNQFKNNVSAYDLKLTKIFENNWSAQALYAVRNDSGLTGTTNGKAGGLGFGYFFSNNFNFRGFYKFAETYGDYKSGLGFQLDLEYKVNFSSNFYIGALLSHRQSKFTENQTIANFKDYTFKSTFPMLTLGFLIN